MCHQQCIKCTFLEDSPVTMCQLVIQWKLIHTIDHVITSFSNYSLMNGMLVLYLTVICGTVTVQVIWVLLQHCIMQVNCKR